MHVHPKRVRLRIDLVRLRRVVQLLEDLAGADAPAFVLDGDEGGGVVVGLEEVGAVHVGGEVGRDELGILATGLGGVVSVSAAGFHGGTYVWGS